MRETALAFGTPPDPLRGSLFSAWRVGGQARLLRALLLCLSRRRRDTSGSLRCTGLRLAVFRGIEVGKRMSYPKTASE